MSRRALAVLVAVSALSTSCVSSLAPATKPASALDDGKTVDVGRSVENRVISAFEDGSTLAPVRLLVVGCIHGNEPAGIAIAKQLERWEPPARRAMWIIPDLNPDGVARNTRQNADGIDLNRNFPWRWEHIGQRGDQQYSGVSALSEPESRAAYRFISRIRPTITIWFHQPAALVDESGGDIRIEQHLATYMHLPLRRMLRYPGSVVNWENQTWPGSSAIVVELRPGTPDAASIDRYARAVESLL